MLPKHWEEETRAHHYNYNEDYNNYNDDYNNYSNDNNAATNSTTHDPHSHFEWFRNETLNFNADVVPTAPPLSPFTYSAP